MKSSSTSSALGTGKPDAMAVTATLAWLTAIRPRTLTIAIAPVWVGVTLAYVDTDRVALDMLLATLFSALLIQIGTNLYNDAADFDAGADRPGHRLGPPRAVAQGWLSSREVRAGATLCFAFAFVIGCYLATRGGWPIVVIGLASLAAAYAYSGGPWRISHSALGELFVMVFFGPVAVGGSYYLQTGELTMQALLAGVYVGAPACAVLLINNHRDRKEDALARRRTLSIVMGEAGSRLLYCAFMAIPFMLLPILGVGKYFWWLPLLALPWVVVLARRLWMAHTGTEFNALLARTAQCQFAVCVAIALAWLFQSGSA